MLFNSIPFLIFFPLFCLAFFFTHGKLRQWVTLLSSYLFYGWWDWRFCLLLLTSTLVDFNLARLIEREDIPARRKHKLIVSLCMNLGFLGFFKYFNFFMASFQGFSTRFGVPLSSVQLHIILPVGISFYTFQSLSYTIDVYRRQIPAERSLLRFAVFIALFPQLVAGPIVRAKDLLPQLHHDTHFDYDRLFSGLTLILWGLFKKVAVADSLGGLVDARFAAPYNHSPLSLLIGVVFYAFQIYCDFSGYSDIAIGVARILGYDFGVNFRMPYLSRSFSEFWTRWHISLSSWLRDYLYIPLGGNRHGAFNTYRNLMVTMLLGGLWHGANWTFLLWGLLHGSYLIVERLFGKATGLLLDRCRIPEVVRRTIAIMIVFALTCLTWIFFRSADANQAMDILRRIGELRDFDLNSVQNLFLMTKGLLLIVILCVVESVNLKCPLNPLFARYPVARAFAFCALLWGLAFAGTFAGARFIYFQF